MKSRVGAVLVAALLVAADPMEDVKKDKDKLKGTWVVQSFQAEGKTIEALKGMTFVFDGDTFTSTVPGQKAVGGAYKLNASKQLKELDLMVDRAGGGRTTTRAIYVFEGDELRIYAAPSTVSPDARGRLVERIGPRPKDTDGRQGAIITLTREKK